MPTNRNLGGKVRISRMVLLERKSGMVSIAFLRLVHDDRNRSSLVSYEVDDRRQVVVGISATESQPTRNYCNWPKMSEDNNEIWKRDDRGKRKVHGARGQTSPRRPRETLPEVRGRR